MIRFGPAGIPLSCKGRTLRDGISDVHHLGLTAMEVQFIKVNPFTRGIYDEEVGKRPMEIPGQLIVEVGPPAKGDVYSDAAALQAPLDRRAQVTTLNWFLAKDYGDLTQAKNLARSVDVRLTLHAPYYVNLVGSPEARERSLRQFQWSCALAMGLGADAVVGHLGFYASEDREGAVRRVVEEVRRLRQWMDGLDRGRILLALEPSGHPEVIGTPEEILGIARAVRRVRPVLNMAHVAARAGKPFETREEVQRVMEEFLAGSHGDLYLNFAGVETYGPGEFRLTPIKRGRMHFDHVAEVLADRDYDATVISSSPLLEHDAMYMKLLYERALSKRFARRHAPPVPKPAPGPSRSPPPAPRKAPAHPAPRRPQSPAKSTRLPRSQGAHIKGGHVPRGRRPPRPVRPRGNRKAHDRPRRATPHGHRKR